MEPLLPVPVISRLCMVYRVCCECQAAGEKVVSSACIGRRLGVGAHTVRKDFSSLGHPAGGRSGYDVDVLKVQIENLLGLKQGRRACVVGLGRLGSAILGYEPLAGSGYKIVAGFDASINRLETFHTDIRLYPAYEIKDVVRRERIEMAIIAVPAAAAQETADALVEGGVRSIVNFAPVVLELDCPDVAVKNIDVVNELRVLSALSTLRGRAAVGSAAAGDQVVPDSQKNSSDIYRNDQ